MVYVGTTYKVRMMSYILVMKIIVALSYTSWLI